MQCQAAAHCPKKINPAGSLAVREARLAAIVQVQDHLTLISPLSLSASPNSVSMHYFVIDCLTLCSQSLSLWCLFSSNQVAEGVCVWICVCLNTRHRLRTYLRKKEKEADTDRETGPGCCNRVSSGLERRALSPLDSHAVKLDGALGAESG